MGFSTAKPLEGVKVIDFSTFVAGPTAGRILSDWGADVIKVERPGGEPGRYTSQQAKVPSDAAFDPYYAAWNAGKKAMAVNTKTKEGYEVFEKLLAKADVFLTNVRTAALVKMGLDFEALHERHPHIIFAQILGFGEVGPDKDNPGFDTVAYWAKSGLMLDLSEKGGAPINPVMGGGDAATGISLAGGIAAALLKQAKTGEGSKVTVSLYGQGIFQMSAPIAESQYGGTFPKSRKEPGSPLMNSYKSKDGRWFFLTVVDTRKFDLFYRDVLRREDLADREDLQTLQGVGAASVEITAEMDQIFAELEWADIEQRLKDGDFAYDVIADVTDVLVSEQAKANQYITPVEGHDLYVTNTPIRVEAAGKPFDYEKPNDLSYAAVGEHTDEVMVDLLGYDQATIAAFREKGAIA